VSFRPSDHLGTVAVIFGVSGLLKENQLAFSVENGNGNPPAILTKEIEVNTLVGYTTPIEIGAYALGQFPVEPPS